MFFARLYQVCSDNCPSWRQLLHWLELRLQPLGERPLLCSSAGLLAGSVLGIAVPLSPWLIGILVLAAGALLSPWSWRSVQRCWRWFFIGLLLAHVHVSWQGRALPLSHVAHLVDAQAPRPVTVDGTLTRAVEAHGDYQHLYLALHRWQEHQDWHAVTGVVRLSVPATPLPFLAGDVVRVTRLRLHQARGFQNPGAFDFQRLMRWQGIYALAGVSDAARLQLQHRPAGFVLARTVGQWRRQLHATVRPYLSPPYDAVFLAMVLGYRGDLSAAVEDSFRKAGATHLLVVSGLNVGFIFASALLAWRMLLRPLRGRLPRTWLPGWRPTPLAAWLSAPVLLWYCTLVGWEIPTTRAAVMAGSYLLALLVSRQRDALHALVLAAALLLLFDPTALFTVGSQLSFVAVACILLTAQRFHPHERASGRLRRWGRRLQVYLVISCAAYLGTVPILAGTFHTLPTFGIPANLLLVPLAGVLTPAGMLALGLVTVWPALGALVFPPFRLLLAWMLAIADFTAALPGVQLHLAAPSWVMLLAYYGLLGGVLWWPLQRWRWQWTGGCLVLLLVSSSWPYIGTHTQQLRVTFLDVGSGNAILVQIPGNYCLLVDGGGTHDGRFDIGTQVIAPFLWDHYVRHFDLIALTHPQADHARGLVSLLRLFPARYLLTNGTPLRRGYLRDLLAAGERWGTQHSTALEGQRDWQWGRLHLAVLAPPGTVEQQHTAWAPPTENDRSLVLRLQYGSVRLLFTGDIQHATERWLLAHRPDLRADILQVAHHGSQTSTLPAFVASVRPHVGIISLGAGNPYGHPHARVLDVLAAHHVEVFRTDYHGAITITSDGAQYQVTPFRPYRPPLTAPSAAASWQSDKAQ
jgi:competence protein ComEC